MRLVKSTLIFMIFSMSTAGFSGVVKTICANGMYRVCIEDPNATHQIKLLSGEERYLLDEIESYELYREETGLFSFAYQTNMLTVVDSETEIKLECSGAKPGTCSGWNF
jgi:hypothetical protein